MASQYSSSVTYHATFGRTEVLVVDNASDPPVYPPRTLANGLGVETIRL